MKKLVIVLFAIFSIASMSAQDSIEQTSKGNWYLGAFTGTGFSLTESNFALSVDGGYFFKDNFAIQIGAGYFSSSSEFIFKTGAKYYLASKFPLGVDFNVSTDGGSSNSSLGLSAGYAWFISNNISIEPTIRYGISSSDNSLGSHIGIYIYF